MLANSNLKQPAEALNLTATVNVIKYNRNLIKKIALGTIVIVLVSIFFVMQNKTSPVLEEEQLSFDHISPKLYNKKATNQLDPNLENTRELKPKANNSKVNYAKSVDLPNGSGTSEHNISLLREYFEQQALIKIKEEDDARVSPISFAMPSSSSSKANQGVNSLLESPTTPANAIETSDHKLLKAGSIIPCVLSTAINSDLPGVVVARVREHVFDTATGKYLLIPQGSILIGHYDNNVNFGQERVQIVFQRIDIPPTSANPNGYSVQLDNLSGTDLAGHAGMADRVDNHYGKVALGVGLSSLLAAAGKDPADYIYPSNPNYLPYSYRAMNKASENISNIANKIADKQMKQSPTITIRGGVPFNIIVAKDLSLQVGFNHV